MRGLSSDVRPDDIVRDVVEAPDIGIPEVGCSRGSKYAEHLEKGEDKDPPGVERGERLEGTNDDGSLALIGLVRMSGNVVDGGWGGRLPRNMGIVVESSRNGPRYSGDRWFSKDMTRMYDIHRTNLLRSIQPLGITRVLD